MQVADLDYRVRAGILGSGGMVVLIGTGWAASLLHLDRPLLAAVNGSLGIFGIALIWLAHQGRLTTAAVLTVHVLPLFVTVSCLFDKVPEGVHRTTQMHFLPVAVGCYFVFRRGPLYLKYFIPVFCLTGFAVFSNSAIGFSDPGLVLPAGDAAMGAWINTFTAVAELSFVVVIMNADLSRRRMMTTEIRKAIANGDFRLHYQPQVDHHCTVVGAEALIRWRHPKMGDIRPCDFIPLAEEAGLIVPIGDWVLRASCAQLAKWQMRPETRHLTLAVNVSASQFRQPDFTRNVTEIVRLSGIAPSTLKLELTESMFIDNVEETVDKMSALSAIGLKWSMDDFGTGYSSLSVLNSFPLSQIKIDQSFIRNMFTRTENMVVTEAIVELAGKLGLDVVAEGVETVEQFDRLREVGCQLYQGYLFSAPVDLEAFEEVRAGMPSVSVSPAQQRMRARQPDFSI